MNAEVDIDKAREDFGGVTNDELMKEYYDDENFRLDDDVMNANNVPIQEIEFNKK
jgi:hypothetical protein